MNSENKSSIENDGYFFKSVTVDPDNLCSENEKLLFTNINQRYNSVFDPTFGAYNDNSGVVRVNVNLGDTLPPPRQGRLPLYNQKTAFIAR